MKKFNLLRVASLAGLILLFLLTFVRENLLLEINALLKGLQYDRSYNYLFANFFKTLPQDQLFQFKWGLTMGFSVVIPIITILALYGWFKSLQLSKLIVKLYGVIFIVVLLVAGIAYAFNSFDAIYLILRRILGVVQSPIPFFFFFVLFYKFNKEG